MPTNQLAALGLALAAVLAAAELRGQNSSIYHRDLPLGQYPPATLENGSWTYLPQPPPKEIRIQDIVTIRVDELARMQAEGDMDRRKNSFYDAVLKDWITLNGLKSIKPSPQQDGDPRIHGQFNQLFRAQGDMATRESLVFNIAAKIVDIRPNGTLVLEAHREIRNNNEIWKYSLTGICRREDIGPDNVLLSRNIVDLRIDKREHGHVRDSYKRGWLLRWLDQVNPF